MGVPTLITMYHIEYQNRKIVARILLHNPDKIETWMTVRVKAYSGQSETYTHFGTSHVGSWNF